MRGLGPCAAAFAAAAAIAGAQPTQRLDLPAAINQALAHNRTLARSALNLEGTALNIPGARAEFGFSLRPDAGVGSSYAEDTYQYGLVAGKKFLPGTTAELGGRVVHAEDDDGERSRRSSMRVDVRQPLFRNFGALVHGENLIRAQQQYRSARRDYEERKADLVVSVVEAFETLIRLERQIQSDEASFQRMDKLYRLTRARERQGRATRVDTLRVELQRGQALSRLANSRERLSFTQRDFAELLGAPPDTVFALEPPPLLAVEVPDSEEALRIALSNRLDYAQAMQDYEDQARGVKIARRGLLPDVNLNARYERVGDSRFDDNPDFEENLWIVGLAGNTDFNQGSERARLGQAVVGREAALETIRIRELSIAREVQQQSSTYRRTLADLQIAERNFKLAESRARLARRLFELGRGDNFSVTDAEEALTQAQDQVLLTRADASVSGYRLLRVMGTLLDHPADLRPILEHAAL